MIRRILCFLVIAGVCGCHRPIENATPTFTPAPGSIELVDAQWTKVSGVITSCPQGHFCVYECPAGYVLAKDLERMIAGKCYRKEKP